MSGHPPGQQDHQNAYTSNPAYYGVAHVNPPQPVGSPPPNYMSPQVTQGAFQPAPQATQPPYQPAPQMAQAPFQPAPQMPISPAPPAAQPAYVHSQGAQGAGYYTADAKTQPVYMAPQVQPGVTPQMQQGQPMYVLSPQGTGMDQYGQPVYTSYVAAPQPTMMVSGDGKIAQPVATPQIIHVQGGSSAGAAAAGAAAGGAAGGVAGGCCGACCGACAACCCCTVM